jgi:hypothetical protein
MDEKALTDFAPLAPEGVTIRLLSDQREHKPSLPPATERWKGQHGQKRPLEVRLAAPRTLHDRLIIIDAVEQLARLLSIGQMRSCPKRRQG